MSEDKNSEYKIVDSNRLDVEVSWVCSDCARAALKLEINQGKRFFSIMTMHEDICDICKSRKSVAASRCFGRLKYRVPKNWK